MNGSGQAANEAPERELSKDVMACAQELATVLAQIRDGQLNPATILIVLKGENGQFGFFGNEGDAFTRVALLETAKSVVMSGILAPSPMVPPPARAH